jgi:hypothetical protein
MDDDLRIRDLFAAEAMQFIDKGFLEDYRDDTANLDKAAEWCFKMADAMMRAREK